MCSSNAKPNSARCRWPRRSAPNSWPPRFAAGATAVQPWLDQQQRLRDAQSADELTRLNRLNNQMTLYRALGGGMS